MRKIKFFWCAFFLVLPLSVFAADITADSGISSVTVYPDFALVTRTASINLPAGDSTVVFANIIPELDENSLRVSAGAAEGLKIIGAQVKKEFLQDDPVEKVKQLKAEIEKAGDIIKGYQDNIKVLGEEKQFLDSIRLFSDGQIPKDLVTKFPAVKDLDDVYGFLGSKLKENSDQVMGLQLKIREDQKKIEALKKELDNLSGYQQKMKRAIKVDIEADKALKTDLNVSYLVGNGYWEPLYDARADFAKAQVEMVSYGVIKQTTGEDWADVEMSLSTARPAVGGNLPYVAPWFIRPYQPPKYDMARKQSAMLGVAQTRAFEAEEKNEAEEFAQTAPTLSRAQEKGVAVVYKLNKKVSVKSDGAEHKLPVSEQMLAAKFEYFSYPRVALSAYLGSRVTNAKDLQLLAGRVNVFLDGDFTGTSNIGNIGPSEEFELYLGVDENVKVKREQVEKKVDETLIANIPSPNKKTTFKYKLTVENYKSKKINVKLFEAIPVSQDDRIKVSVSNVSLEPKVKDW
ncbi:MAG: mucoidy inhibitor MuiA family protein, partial [Candidatus Omnitrophota bacterium]|nr:mucoidy inhibitor MuiA family protein [Candidatus Omnitrophota bacterium]